MPHRSKQQWLGQARALMTALVLCCVAGPLHAAKEETRVLMLSGVDPYLPPFLAMDKATRESLAGKPADRYIISPNRSPAAAALAASGLRLFGSRLP